MPQNNKYYGNVFGIPTGSPEDDPFTQESFPDGAHAVGYIRRSLPSERFLDALISPVRADREDGYLPSPPPRGMPENWFKMTPDQQKQWEEEGRREAREFLGNKEAADRALQRSMRITEGNATGSFTGPPDRVRGRR